MPKELMILMILAVLPFFFIFLHQSFRRPFIVLLAWLFVAPIVTNWFQRTAGTPIFTTQGVVEGRVTGYQEETQVTLNKLINPNRTFIVLLVLVLFFNNALLKKMPSVPLDPTEIRMGIFSLILLTNAILWAGRPAFALHTAVDSFIVPFFVYYCARRLVTNEERLHRLTRVIVYIAVYVIIFCLIERLTQPGLFVRTVGPFESANTTHVVMIVAFYTAMLYLLPTGRFGRIKKRLAPVVAWFVACLAPIVIALTTVRGNYVGFLASSWVFLLFCRRLTNLSRQSRVIGWGLLLLPVLVFTLQRIVPEEFFEERVGNTGNVLGRFAAWIATLRVALQAPIFGVGFNNLYAFLATRPESFGGVENLTTPHNSYISMFAELGGVGFIAYVAIIMSIMKTGLILYRTGADLEIRWQGAVLMSMWVGYLTPSFFANTLYVPGLIHIYVYVLAGAMAGVYRTRRVTALIRYKRQHPMEHPMALRWESKG
jgi:O-antigen ligase